jgi:NADH-quinone oxidoreductase subunit J
MAHFLFFLLAIVCVGAVVAMIISKNQAYSALFLILAFVCLAALFGLLDAPFIAVIQIIVYAGAIMVLFIFVIMMIDLREGITPERKRWIAGMSFVIAGVLIVELISALKGFISPAQTAVVGSPGSPTDLGHLLFTKYLYPFEITSILIIAALVGAMILVKKKEGEGE